GPAAAGKVRALVETSLARLRRNHLDLIQLHGTTYSTGLADQVLAPDSILDHLARLQEEGLVRFLGLTSEDNNPAVYRFIESNRFDVMQIAYNPLFQQPYETTRPFGSMI